MSALMCMARYERQRKWRQYGSKMDFTDLFCQYPRGHQGGHSWAVIEQSDELEMYPPLPPGATTIIPGDGPLVTKVPTPDEVATSIALDVIERIDKGEFDSWLEPILSAAHDRKRALRGQRFFKRTLPR